MTKAAPVANAAHGNSIQFAHVSNVCLTRDLSGGGWEKMDVVKGQVGLSNKRHIFFGTDVGGWFPNFRVLPWSLGDVTFMQLTGAADFAVTGPLSGCTVSVVRHAGSVWFFHANVAGGGGVGPANLLMKLQMIWNAGTIVGIPAAAAYRYCEYGHGLQYKGLGFVWGRRRPNGVWKFYVHEIRPPGNGSALQTNTTYDTKWATV
jgi:hypothetical protein